MPRVYTTFNIRNEFIAFWQKDNDHVSFFLPENALGETYLDQSLKEWASTKAHYTDHQYDIAQYEDIVNAAWHFLSIGNLIDRSKVSVSTMEPGKFYPRIWRGRYEPGLPSGYRPINPRQAYGYKHVQSTVAASGLFDYMVDIFRYTEPAKENYQSFGHKIRELLILSCTEIESSWRKTPISVRFNIARPIITE